MQTSKKILESMIVKSGVYEDVRHLIDFYFPERENFLYYYYSGGYTLVGVINI